MKKQKGYIKTSQRLPRKGRRVLGFMPEYFWPDLQLRIVIRDDDGWRDDRTDATAQAPLCWIPLPLPSASIMKQAKQMQDSLRKRSADPATCEAASKTP